MHCRKRHHTSSGRACRRWRARPISRCIHPPLSSTCQKSPEQFLAQWMTQAPCPSQRAWAAALCCIPLCLLPWFLYRSRPPRACQLRGHRVHFDLTMAQQQGRCPVAVAYLALERTCARVQLLVCHEAEGYKPRPEGRWVFSIIVSAVRLKPVLSISCTTIGVCMPIHLLSSWPLCRPDRQSFRGTSFPKSLFRTTPRLDTSYY